MSGGSMNYFYAQLEEYASCLKDKELVALAEDMARLLHDREWYDSGDIGEGGWNLSVAEFKKKWFAEPREERLERYIDEAVSDLKVSLGIGNFCKDCALLRRRMTDTTADARTRQMCWCMATKSPVSCLMRGRSVVGTDKAIFKICTAKLCPKCIKEMEAEYIVYLTHEQQRNPMRDKAMRGYCDRCHEESLMLRMRQYTMNARTLKAKGYADKWREYVD